MIFYESDSACVALGFRNEEEVENYSFNISDIQLYPNPSYGKFTIENVEGCTIEIYNLIGTKVFVMPNSKQIETIDIQKFNNGIYMLKAIKAGTVVSTHKLIIVK